MGKSLFKLLFVLLLVGTVQTVYAQEPYAVLSENNTVLTFYYDGDKVSKNGYGIGPFELNDTRWGGNSSNITKVVFDSSFKNCTSITSTAYWFFGCYYLATIEGIDNLKTGNVVDMTAMFADCRSLTSLTLWNFDTSNVTNMSSMFQDCSGLVSLTLEWEHTEKVTDMSCMFRGCKKIGSLKLTHFNTKNVTNMWCMFYDCTELTVLDIYYFDTSNVTNMNSMFQDCPNLIDIDLRGFNTEKVTNMGQMFDGCSKLKKLDMSKFNTQNVTNFQCLFMNCAELTTLDLSTFNTAQVEHMGQVFEGCSKLQTIYVDKDKWTTSAVTFGPRTFDGCTSLIGGAGTAYNAEQIDYTYARIDGGSGNPGYLTDKNATIILCPDNNHPHVIDLGLPSGTKWACCNIGASEPSAFGNQYAWGETETKSKYTWETYIYCNGSKETCQDIGTNIARTEYDVAHVKWGGSYQIPSVDDIKELIDNCTKRSVTYEGIYYTGPNGNTIFVPSRMYGWSDETGHHGNYWTSDLSDELHIAMNWFVWESVYPAKWNNNGRESGFFVRPVAKGGGESPAEETEEVIKITSAGQTTWCSASDLDFTGVDGLKAYIAPGYNRTIGTIWLMRVFEVPANEGILLIGDPGEYKVPKKSTTTYYKNMFKGTLEAITINETEGEYTNYYLSNGTSGVGFYKVDGTQKIGANRAYLPLLKGTTQSGTRFIGIEFGDGTTSVKEVKSGEVKGEKWYTLQGQRVAKPGKGLYIRNGKKVVIK